MCILKNRKYFSLVRILPARKSHIAPVKFKLYLLKKSIFHDVSRVFQLVTDIKIK